MSAAKTKVVSFVVLLSLAVGLIVPAAAFAVLPAGTSVYGQVRDAVSGDPVANAEIYASGGDLGEEMVLVATASATGYYYADIAAGTYSMAAVDPLDRHADDGDNGIAADPASPTLHDFELAPFGKAVLGQVTDDSNNPIAGALVFLKNNEDPSSATYFERTKSTDAQGKYEFWAPPGVYDVYAGKAGYALSATAQDLVFNGTDSLTQDLTLVPLPKAVGGSITSAATGAPISGATVILKDATATTELARTTTGGDGAYSFYRAAGTYSLQVFGPGYVASAPSTVVFDGVTAVTKDFSLALMQATSLKLTASTTALPLATSSVTLTATLRKVNASGPTLSGQSVAIQVWSDEAGDWVDLKRVPTNSAGQVALTFAPKTTQNYRAVYDGVAQYYPSSTSSLMVMVPIPTHLSVKASATTLARYGDPVTITGMLRKQSATGPALTGATVAVQAYSGGKWTTVKNLTTSSTGAVSWSTVPRSATSYRLAYSGSAGRFEARVTSAVKVVPRAYLSAVSGSRYATRAYRLSGYLRPKHAAGSYVRVYRWKYVNGTWKSYGYLNARVADYSSTTSRFAVSYRFPSVGKWRLRAVHVADSGHATSYSAYTTLSVR